MNSKTKYIKIVPISDKNSSYIDTLRYVSNSLNISYTELLRRMGFFRTSDILNLRANARPHFVLGTYLIRKVNEVCAEANAPIRVGREVKKGIRS